MCLRRWRGAGQNRPSLKVAGSYALGSPFAMRAGRLTTRGWMKTSPPPSGASPRRSSGSRRRPTGRRPSRPGGCSATIRAATPSWPRRTLPCPWICWSASRLRRPGWWRTCDDSPAGWPRTTSSCGACAARARARWPRPPSWPWPPNPALKLVEVDRDEVAALPGLFDRLRGRAERFVVLCDDLSFEEGAAAAKALKSALEGGVSGPPDNALFVATSNRRHLMPRDHVEGRGADRRGRGRRGGGQRLRPLRPVDRLPADGPGRPIWRRCAPTPTGSTWRSRISSAAPCDGRSCAAPARAASPGSSSATWPASWARRCLPSSGGSFALGAYFGRTSIGSIGLALSTGVGAKRTSKCSWGSVTPPVCPTCPSSWPWVTVWRICTLIRSRWA